MSTNLIGTVKKCGILLQLLFDDYICLDKDVVNLNVMDRRIVPLAEEKKQNMCRTKIKEST